VVLRRTLNVLLGCLSFFEAADGENELFAAHASVVPCCLFAETDIAACDDDSLAIEVTLRIGRGHKELAVEETHCRPVVVVKNGGENKSGSCCLSNAAAWV
jgi:hypothetical protein